METINPQRNSMNSQAQEIHHSQYKIIKAIKKDKNKGTKMNITEFSSETIREDNGETSLKH